MTEIIETRTLKISDRIIKSQDIRRLFADLEKEFNRLDDITKETLERKLTEGQYSDTEKVIKREFLKDLVSKTFKIKASDGSIYQGHSNEIIALNGILDTKQISSFDFHFSDNNHKSVLSINLRHTNTDNWNEVTVQGIDSLWVNGIIKQIENFLDTIERQITWIKKYGFVLTFFFAICMTIVTSTLLLKCIVFLSQHFPPDPSSPKISISFVRVVSFLAMFGFSFYPAMTLTNKIKELWPTVELQTGQDFGQVEKQKRNKVGLIFSLIILPTVLTILIDLMEVG